GAGRPARPRATDRCGGRRFDRGPRVMPKAIAPSQLPPVSSQTRAPSRRAKTERDPRFDEALSQALAPAPASSAHRPSPPPPKAAMPSADGRRGDADATHAARGSGVGPNHEAPSHEATSGSATPPPDGEDATTAPSLRNHASDHASDA